MRFAEAVAVLPCDLHGDGTVYIRSVKGTSPRQVQVTEFLYVEMTKGAVPGQPIFSVDYWRFYRYLKSEKKSLRKRKGSKNFSVTHSPRRKLIQKMFYDYRNPVDFIVRKFGWKEKKSIFYYL